MEREAPAAPGARVLVGIGPLCRLGTKVLDKGELFLALGLFWSFAYFYQGGFDNQNARFDLTLSIAFEHTLAIDAFHENTLDKARHDGHFFLEKSPIASYLALPAALAGAALLSTDDLYAEPRRADLLLYAATLSSLSLLSAIAAIGFKRLLCLINPALPPGLATALTAAVFLGTILWPYSTVLFGHQLTGTLLVVGLYLGLADPLARAVAPGRAKAFAASLALALAAANEYPSAVLALAAATSVVLLTPRPGRVSLVAPALAGVVVPALFILGTNTLAFGSPFAMGYGQLGGTTFGVGMSRGMFGIGAPSLPNAMQLLFGGYRGLFVYSPILIVPATLFWRWPRRERRTLGMPLVVGVVLHLLVISGYAYWQGGPCFGPRHLVAAVPLLALGLAFFPVAWARRPWFLGLVALSVLLNLVGTATTPFVHERVTSPLTTAYVSLVVNGAVAKNPAGLLTPSPGRAWRRRDGGADGLGAFNLGTLAGLSGWWSVAPLFAGWLAIGVACARFEARRRRACREGQA
jgi:hypothetical protein